MYVCMHSCTINPMTTCLQRPLQAVLYATLVILVIRTTCLQRPLLAVLYATLVILVMRTTCLQRPLSLSGISLPHVIRHILLCGDTNVPLHVHSILRMLCSIECVRSLFMNHLSTDTLARVLSEEGEPGHGHPPPPPSRKGAPLQAEKVSPPPSRKGPLPSRKGPPSKQKRCPPTTKQNCTAFILVNEHCYMN